MRNKKYSSPRGIGPKRCYQNIFYMLGIVLRYAPGYFINLSLYQIYCSVQVFFEFPFTLKVLLDLITKQAEYKTAVAWMLLMLALVLVKLAWAAWMENVTMPRAQEILHKKLRMELYEKAAELDLEQYDDPKYYNEFVWSISEAAGRMDSILKDYGNFLNQAAGMIVSGAFFVTLDAFGIVFILMSLAVTLVMKSYSGRLQFARDAELKPIERKRSYFNRIFYLNDYAKEMRLNPVADRLRAEFSETNEKVYPVVSKYGKKNVLAEFVGDFCSNDILINTVYLGYLVYQTVVSRVLAYGSTMALFSSSSWLKNSLRNLALILPKLEQHGLYVEKIRTFLAFESKLPGGGQKLEEGAFQELSVENGSFAYGNDSDTLHDISLSIKAGEKIAIVGYNGAGKSTLIKLLLRLYDVQQGKIRLNGQDIKEYDKKNYRSQFATVFQDYKLFAASIADNVRMDVAPGKPDGAGRSGASGKPGASDKLEALDMSGASNRVEAADKAEVSGKIEVSEKPEVSNKLAASDQKEIERALEQSGFTERLATLPGGIQTPLTREFDAEGVNLSGGEAQKVAIARTFYKYCPIIILDEPSSALDPISEYQLNQAMLEAAKDKTVIFISHRLSSTVMADRIYMLEQGRIIEQGNHRELMELDGAYAHMFRIQAEKYNVL